MSKRTRLAMVVTAAGLLCLFAACEGSGQSQRRVQGVKASTLGAHLLDKAGLHKGLCAILGSADGRLALEVVRSSEFLVIVRDPREDAVAATRETVDVDGLWCRRVIVEKGSPGRIPCASGTVDLVIAAELSTADLAGIDPKEILRALRPKGKAVLGCRKGIKGATAAQLKTRLAALKPEVSEDRLGVWAVITKPVPDGTDSWSHWEKGPDNNPVSKDALIRAPYTLQWLGKPYYVAMPAVTTAAGGRTFAALGHVAHHEREWPTLYTLIVRNGYNGQILWKRKLPEGYLVHRSAFIATEDVFYMIDGSRALCLDPETGREVGEVRIPGNNDAWHWMTLEGSRLYVLCGPPSPVATKKSRYTWGGWAWSNLSKGYYEKRVPWGWGKTITALDVKTRKLLWTHEEDQPVDSRAMAAGGGKVFFYGPDSHVGCLNAQTGSLLWANDDAKVRELIEAPGDKLPGHQPGFRSTAYCLYTPQALVYQAQSRLNVVAVSPTDGKLLWHREKPTKLANMLYADGRVIGAIGPWASHVAVDPRTGKVLENLRFNKYGCARLTGNTDSFFVRGEGLLRYDRQQKRIVRNTSLRAGCNAGVISANGLLYLGPWFCDCNLSLIGTISLCSAPQLETDTRKGDPPRLEKGPGDAKTVKPLSVTRRDWPTYRANNRRSASSPVKAPTSAVKLWEYRPGTPVELSPPCAAGGLIFVGGEDGKVRAIDAASGKERWSFATTGPVRMPPGIWEGRACVGSADGWVYALEAVTGRLLWRSRVAPAERRVMLYGALCSTWPVNSGVLVEDGMACAAAGIIDFAGTHVVALDAVTGEMKWHNGNSGRLSDAVRNGVSVQGCLTASDGKLLLAGGNQVSPAAFDMNTGKLVSDVKLTTKPRANRGQDVGVFGDGYVIFGGKLMFSSTRRVVSTAYFSVRKGNREYRLVSGRTPPAWNDDVFLFCHSYHAPVACDAKQIREVFNKGYPSVPKGEKPQRRPWAISRLSKDAQRRFGSPSVRGEYVSLVLAANAALVVERRQAKEGPPRWSLIAYALNDAKVLWRHELTEPALRGGLLIDRDGRVILSLRNGGLICYGAKR